MTDFYQSNRSVTASYRKKLEDKIALTLRPEELPETHEADLQKVYLEFKNRVVPIVHEETEKHQKELLETNNCHLILLKQTALVDTLVRAALKTAVAYYNHRHQARLNEPEVPVALVARGGYGREEMYFRSDVEIQVVHKPPADDAEAHLAEELIKHFEYLFVFQDIFSTASRSSHSETTGQEQNLTPQNLNEFLSLLEHRFVAGNPVVYTEFKSSIRTALLLHKEDLVKHCHKYESHYQVQNTVFRQEPNVKEDLARLYWALTLTRIRNDLECINQFELLQDLYARGIISAPAFKNLQNALHFLAQVRLFLHWVQKGAQRDLLNYEVRDKIAHFMKFELKEFFKEYFYQAGYPLKRYSRNLFWNNMTLDRTKVRDLSDHFALNAENQIFAQRSPEPLFTQSPHWIFKIFAWVAEKDYYLSYPLIRSIEDHLDKTGPIFFGEETRAEVQACFKRVIRGKHFAKALRLMHEFHLLSDFFIPEFKPLCGLLQDIYVHKFPTDMHILSSLDALNLLDLRKEEADPFLTELYHSLKDKTTMKLAVLLHDIGKGARTSDQDDEELMGARMVPSILENLSFGDKPRRIRDVAFLVEKHLTMYDLMLLDPEDDDTYEMVWDLVHQDKERFKMLVLLTYADRAGTKMKMSPTQLEQLKLFYQYTLFHKKHEEVPKSVKVEFMEMVRLPHDMQSQLEIYHEFCRSKNQFAADFLFRPNQPSELVVCAKDQEGLLFKISTLLAFNQMNIIEANIQTSRDNVFDVFKVVDPSGRPLDHSTYFFIRNQIKDDLRRVFVEQESIAEVFKGRNFLTQSEKHPYKDVKLKVKIIGRSVTLTTHDLFGTFMMETKVFSNMNVGIQRAVLHSAQGTASNIFYLRPEDLNKITQRKTRFESLLKEMLRPLIDSKLVLLENTTEAAR